MADSAAERLLAGLTEAQRGAVTADPGTLCVVAGAGSGKTTVLTRRVAWRVATGAAEAGHVLVVTFTRKAAVELQQRLRGLGVGGITAATFHAAAFAQLRRHWADQGEPAPRIVSDPGRIVRALLDKRGLEDPELVRVVLGELSWARARGMRADQYPRAAGTARRSAALSPHQLGDLLAGYEAEKRRRRVLDLDDLVLCCAELLETDPTTAAAVRWRVQHLFVDEFQDVNPAQWRLLEAWRHGRPDLCVVGDPRQAIYAWNGSDPSLLDRFPDLVPGTITVRLDENHRSSPQIVGAASALLAAAGDDISSLPVAIREDHAPPTVSGFDDEDAEAEAVTRWLRATRRVGQPWAHQAVLARTHARLEAVAAALDRAGIPSRRAGRRGRPPALRAVLEALRRVGSDAPARSALVEVVAALTEVDWSHAMEQAAAQLCRAVDEHAADEVAPTVGSFLAWVAANRGAIDVGEQPSGDVTRQRDPVDPDMPPGDAVTLATFHQAKGLEWPTVALVGLEEGTVPIGYATSKEALAEERRLLFVAVTRAESLLWCSWAARSSGNVAGRVRRASSLLEPLRSAVASQAPLPAEAALARVGALRQRLAATA